jgi:hypothetical protein
MHRPDPWVLSRDNLRCLPVCHYRLEYAEQVRHQMRKEPPDAVALELPAHLAGAYMRAVARLPEVSVLLYEAPSGRTLYLPVEPVDPFSEAARTALEQGIPLHLVDMNLEEAYPRFRDPVPDPYAIHTLGARAFYRAFQSIWEERIEKHPLDIRREQAMAFHLQGLMSTHGNVLFLGGMLHCRGVLENLRHPQTTPLQPQKCSAVQLFHLHPDCLDEVMATVPFLSAVYETRRSGLPGEPEEERFTVRRQFRIQDHPFILLEKDGPVYNEQEALKASLSRVARRSGWDGEASDPENPIDRNRANLFLMEEAGRHYREETGEKLKGWQKKVFWRFVRNYAVLEGLLLPDFFHLLSGARSCVDDNYCHALLRLGRFYPWQQEVSGQPTLRLSGEDVWLGTRKIRVRRWLPGKKRKKARIAPWKRKREAYPGQWLESFDGNSLCSFPPEDIVVENHGRELRKNWNRKLRNEQTLTEPFLHSMQDGIDIRETLRRWSEKRIHVRVRHAVKDEAGALVVIFQEDEQDSVYPYKMTWLGEHEQESDMAFYATPPENHIVGPGICRCEYGGFMMSYPPRRLYDVWKDPDYRGFFRKSEVLLAAAIEYSVERRVVYVAHKAPRSYMRTLAERMQRQIVYLPVGSLSPTVMKRLRVFHILSGYDKRETAKEYILD